MTSLVDRLRQIEPELDCDLQTIREAAYAIDTLQDENLALVEDFAKAHNEQGPNRTTIRLLRCELADAKAEIAKLKDSADRMHRWQQTGWYP